METSMLAALLTAVILVGGVAAAAAMGGFSGLGIGDKAPEAGDHGMRDGHDGMGHGMMGDGHGMMTGEGMHGEDHAGKSRDRHEYSHEHEHRGSVCGCSVIMNATWYNATVKSVSYEGGYAVLVLDDGNNTEVRLFTHKGMPFVEMSTGYMVYGPWVIHQLVPNMTVQVLVAEAPAHDGWPVKVVGINIDGRVLVLPVAAEDHAGES